MGNRKPIPQRGVTSLVLPANLMIGKWTLGMDDDNNVKPAGVLCTPDSNAKEMNSSTEAEATVVEEAGNSPSPFSASEEEGVTRSAAVS